MCEHGRISHFQRRLSSQNIRFQLEQTAKPQRSVYVRLEVSFTLNCTKSVLQTWATDCPLAVSTCFQMSWLPQLQVLNVRLQWKHSQAQQNIWKQKMIPVLSIQRHLNEVSNNCWANFQHLMTSFTPFLDKVMKTGVQQFVTAISQTPQPQWVIDVKKTTNATEVATFKTSMTINEHTTQLCLFRAPVLFRR